MKIATIHATVIAVTLGCLFNQPSFNTENQYFGSSFTSSKTSKLQSDGIQLSFTSSVKYGSQKNQISVLVSTDFNGVYTIEDIYKATWTKVEQPITYASGESPQESGSIDISSLIKSGKPFYVAFKYTGDASLDEKPKQRTWQINNVKIAGQDITSFKFVNHPENDAKTGWSNLATGGIVFKPAATLKKSEGWAIIKF